MTNLKDKFQQRNYPDDLIDSQFERAKKKERKSLIYQQPKAKNSKDDRVRLIFTHSRANPPIHKWVRESKHLLNRNEKAKDIGSRIQVASRQPRNLQNLVGGSREGQGGSKQIPPEAGCFKSRKNCKVSILFWRKERTSDVLIVGKYIKSDKG